MREIVVELPRKLQFLMRPMRYKVAKGGRGSGKSWSFARALLIQGAIEPLRIGCFREVQKSIDDSVHKLLKDQVQGMGLGAFYDVLAKEIRGVNGTEFLFAGLSDLTAESIKSFEGLDRAWVEEAKSVSKRSWDILLPTIRKTGSEIWVSYNPDLETDATDQIFVANQPDDAQVVDMNYFDNPWFNDVLEKERQRTLKTDPEGYKNIWLGQYRPAVEGAIFYNEVSAAVQGKRVCNIPYDPALKVHVVFDLGWNDSMSIILAQRSLSEVRIIEYIEDDHKTLDFYSAELRKRNYNWGTMWLPHDGATKDFKTGKSAQQIMQELGWSVDIIAKADVEGGIKLARMTFPRVYFNEDKTKRLMECLKRYRRQINKTTNHESGPLHDEYSHGGDCFRYLCSIVEQMTNDTWGGGSLKYPDLHLA